MSHIDSFWNPSGFRGFFLTTTTQHNNLLHAICSSAVDRCFSLPRLSVMSKEHYRDGKIIPDPVSGASDAIMTSRTKPTDNALCLTPQA